MSRCQDKNCSCYGEELVDRGYGYPVCPSTPLRTFENGVEQRRP